MVKDLEVFKFKGEKIKPARAMFAARSPFFIVTTTN